MAALLCRLGKTRTTGNCAACQVLEEKGEKDVFLGGVYIKTKKILPFLLLHLPQSMDAFVGHRLKIGIYFRVVLMSKDSPTSRFVDARKPRL